MPGRVGYFIGIRAHELPLSGGGGCEESGARHGHHNRA